MEKKLSRKKPIVVAIIVIIAIAGVGGYFALKGEEEKEGVPAPAKFEVSNLIISPSEAEPGDAVTVLVDVSNVGNERGTYTVKLKIDGVVQQTKSVTLDNGENTSVSFTVIKNIEGSYNIEISGLTGSFEIIKPAPEPIILQGTSDKATTTFVLEEGISIFRMTHDGWSNFAIWLYDAETGERVDLLVNEIGPFSGSTIVGVTGKIGQASPGSHLLDITADGNWEVIIEQPRPTTAPIPPQTFTGRGHSVPSPFMLEKGIAIFEMTHDGRSNFAIWLYDKNGYRVDLLVNEIGTYSGSTVVGVTGQILEASPEIHYLDITADGNWRVIVTQ